MSNAAKFRKKAAELESQRDFDKAIVHYARAIEAGDAAGEEVDVAVLNKVGDLTLRLGRVPEAVASYERAVEHYTAVGLFNNAIALCNKILRHAPGRVGIYLTLGRVCARKGMRGDATRNFLEYASRMQKEGRNEEAMTSLGEVASLMPELTEVRRLVEEHAARVGIELPAAVDAATAQEQAKEAADSLVFLDIDYDAAVSLTPPIGATAVQRDAAADYSGNGTSTPREQAATPTRSSSLDDLLIFDPSTAEDDFEFADPLDGFEANSPEPETDELVVSPASLVDDEVISEGVTSPTDASVPEGLTDALGFEPAEDNGAPAAEALDGLVPDAEHGMLLDMDSPTDAAASEPAVEALSVGETEADHTDEVALAEAEQADVEQDVEWIDVSSEDVTSDVSIDDAMEADLEAEHEAELEAEHEAELEADLEAGHEAGVEAELVAGQEQQSAPLEFLDLDAMEAMDDADRDLGEAVAAVAIDDASAAAEAVSAPVLIEEIEQAISSEIVTEEEAAFEFDSVDVAPASVESHDAESPIDVYDPPESVDATDAHPELEAVDPTDADAELEAVDPTDADAELEAVVPTDAYAEPEAEDPTDADAELEAAAAPESDEASESDDTPDVVRAYDEVEAADLVHQTVSSLRDQVAERWRTSVPRLDPHDFILPGELPPLVIPDALLPAPVAHHAASSAADPVDAEGNFAEDTESAETITAPDFSALLDLADDELVDAVEAGVAHDSEERESTADVGAVNGDDLEAITADASDLDDNTPDTSDLDALLTPEAPTAVVNVALIRCERLREEADEHPGDWTRRRRLAEALLEAGELEAGLTELATTSLGLEVQGQLADAARVTDDMVRAAPDNIGFHQKRVELAVRLGDRERLRDSYLDLADALVRTGLAARAESVYVRVLELDPWDDRARIALGDAAPPPPARPSAPSSADDGYVNLADWLSDDGDTADTRMRLREPTITGDENADFDQLLQHFREGVARSLGEDDYESHYDLGVAYKEMGLLDDAIAEFQRALRSPTHRLPAYEALGQCFLEQGSFPVAVTVLSRALHEPGLNDDQRVGVLYLLGYACEALQRRDEARSYFQRVYATDIQFRDVAERLAALEQVA